VSTQLQKYLVSVSFLGMTGLVHVTVSAFDEFHAVRLAEMTFPTVNRPRVESIKLVA